MVGASSRRHVGRPARWRVLAATLVLASVLLGALAAGSPVPDEQSVATSTAGIHLGTSPALTRAPVAALAPPFLSQELLRLLVLVVAGLSVAITFAPVPGTTPALRWLTVVRRGPPLTSSASSRP